MAFISGDQLIWALLAFGAGIWAVTKYSGMKASTSAILVGALVLALFMQDITYAFGQDALTALALLALVVVGVQYLFKTSFEKGLALVLTSWIIGSILLNGMVW